MVGRENYRFVPRKSSKPAPLFSKLKPQCGDPIREKVSFPYQLSLQAGRSRNGGLMDGRTEHIEHLFGAWGTQEWRSSPR